MTDHTAEAEALSRMLGAACPRCRQRLQGHEYQLFAQTIATDDRKENVICFFEFAKAHDWENLGHYQDFDGSKNASEIYALKCPHGDLTMLYVRDPFELFDSKSLGDWESLGSADATEWNKLLLSDRWISPWAAVTLH